MDSFQSSAQAFRKRSSEKFHFTPPPLDGSLPVFEWIDWHYQYNQSHTIFMYSYTSQSLDSLPVSSAASVNPIEISYCDFSPAVHKAGAFVSSQVDILKCSMPVVAILAISDTITYCTTVLGLLRAGLIAFPISPRFSPEAIGHLLTEARVTHILVSPEPAIHELVNASLEATRLQSMEVSGFKMPHVLNMPIFSDLFNERPFNWVSKRITGSHESYMPAILLHTSNSSSAFPRVIPWNSDGCFQAATVSVYNYNLLCNEILGCHGIELFHAIGISVMSWVLCTGAIMATFPPASPPISPTPELVFQGFQDCSVSYAIASAGYIEIWSAEPSKTMFMTKLRGIIYGGKFLSKRVGEYLTKQGVNIITSYGSTELGPISKICPDDSEVEWEYFQISPHAPTRFIHDGPGAFQLVVLPSDNYILRRTNGILKGKPATFSGDIFIPHPSKKKYWKIIGRTDNQIMLSSGDVVNPEPLERFLCGNPIIVTAVVFGRARPFLGVLIQLAESLAVSRDEALLQVKSRIELMNKTNLPTCHISSNMVILVNGDKLLPLTSKGLPRRSTAYLLYQDEISTTYSTVQDRLLAITNCCRLSDSDVPAPAPSAEEEFAT